MSDRRVRGFSIVELMVVLALVATATLFVGTLTVRLYRRYCLFSAAKQVQYLVLATRMQAIRRNQNAVLFVDLANRRVFSFADPNGNFAQDAGEPILNEFVVPPVVVFARPPQNTVDGADAVSFDGYAGNVRLVDMIVFTPDGKIVPPQGNDSNAPRSPPSNPPDIPYGSIECRGTNVPSTGLPPLHGQANSNNGMGCRGIFMGRLTANGTAFSDDVFRISADDVGPSGRVTILKYIGSQNREGLYFVPPNPGWIWFD
jgi:prepilin-type N-terminal cleavage/methylation domain-containing protein